MSVTVLADLIVPEEFNEYTVNLTHERSELLNSGLMVDMTAQIDAQIAGKTVEMPFLNDLYGTSEVLDDTTDLSVGGVDSGQDTAVKLLRGKAFGASDISADLSGADPMALIATRYADWWNRDDQATLFATLKGAFSSASVLAGEGGFGNVLDISGATGGAENFDADSFIDAVFRLGDRASDLSAVAVHSQTLKRMVKADLIDFIPDSEGKLTIPTYMGKTVLVMDEMPADGGNYTTYLFGPGAIGYGTKSPRVPTEVGRDGLKGSGQEWIIQRRQYVMHPRGIRWIGTSAKATPSNAELANPLNWERVVAPKSIKVVKFVHKLAA